MKSIRLTRFIFVLAPLAGCGDGEGITAPRPGTLEIVISTSGPEPDADGFTVQIDAGDARPVGAGETFTAPGIAQGSHTIELGQIAANCTVSGPNPQTVMVTSGETARVAFDVVCTATTGSMQVVVNTTGSGLDPDGYTVQIDAGDAQPIGVTASLTITGVAPGSHSVRLDGIAPNCTLPEPNPQTVDVVAGEAAVATFTVTCSTTGSIQVLTVTTGSALDPDGYLVSVDGGAPQPIGANATLVIEGLAFGAHTVELSGASSNCHINGENPLTVNVVPMNSVAPGFAVSCLGADALIAFGSVDVDLEAIFTVQPDGSGLRQLTPAGEFDRDPIWSPDGTRLLFGLESDVFVMNADGSERRRLVAGLPEAAGYRWSPDGRQIAFTQGGFVDDEFVQDLWVVEADGSGSRRLARDAAAPSWSPDSRRIAYEGGGQIRTINADGTGNARLTTQRFGAFQPAWSPEGSRIAFVTTLDEPPDRPADRHIFVVNPDGTGLANLSRGSSDDDSPTWSPDGSRIAFVTNEGDPEGSEIFLMDSSGEGRTNLTRQSGFDFSPNWSPDGSMIVFHRFDDDDSEIYVMQADGGGRVNVSNRPESAESAPDWGGQGATGVPQQRFLTHGHWSRAQLERRLRGR